MENKQRSEITVEKLDPLRVASYHVFSTTPENDAHQYMQAWLDKHNITANVRNFGFDVEVPADQAGEGVRGYEVWRTVPASVQEEDGVTIRDYPGGLYAVLTLYLPFPPHNDPFESIPGGWKYLHEWVISSDQYRGGSHQWLEELLPGEGGDNLKLYHPIIPVG